MGGGFYDRTLARWFDEYQTNKSTKPYPIGLAHDCQFVSEVPCELWDIPLPEIITPKRRYTF
jgi:5-formyltetrahydrofolate cyclo-ligase